MTAAAKTTVEHLLAWGCPVAGGRRTCCCGRDEACAVVRVARDPRVSAAAQASALDEVGADLCDGGRDYCVKAGHGVTVVYASGRTRTVRA